MLEEDGAGRIHLASGANGARRTMVSRALASERRATRADLGAWSPGIGRTLGPGILARGGPRRVHLDRRVLDRRALAPGPLEPRDRAAWLCVGTGPRPGGLVEDRLLEARPSRWLDLGASPLALRSLDSGFLAYRRLGVGPLPPGRRLRRARSGPEEAQSGDLEDPGSPSIRGPGARPGSRQGGGGRASGARARLRRAGVST